MRCWPGCILIWRLDWGRTQCQVCSGCWQSSCPCSCVTKSPGLGWGPRYTSGREVSLKITPSPGLSGYLEQHNQLHPVWSTHCGPRSSASALASVKIHPRKLDGHSFKRKKRERTRDFVSLPRPGGTTGNVPRIQTHDPAPFLQLHLHHIRKPPPQASVSETL